MFVYFALLDGSSTHYPLQHGATTSTQIADLTAAAFCPWQDIWRYSNEHALYIYHTQTCVYEVSHAKEDLQV